MLLRIPSVYKSVTKITSLTKFNDGYDLDRKSTRLNSSHQIISYAVFCLKKKKKKSTEHK